MKRTCPTCGHSIAEYKHSLNAGLVHAATVLADCGGEAVISKMGISHTQINNFHKLSYFGLVRPLGDGVWKITERGHAFLDGREAVPRWAITLNGKVQRYEGELITIKTYLPRGYMRRADYAGQNRQPAEPEQTLFGGAA